jgi:hypothetical protein
VAAGSKAWVRTRLLSGNAGSNPAGGYGCPSLVNDVFSGRILCDGPITRPEEPFLVWCVAECDREDSI